METRLEVKVGMPIKDQEYCLSSFESFLGKRDLIIVSNRGPFAVQIDSTGDSQNIRSGGGLVTALLGLANQVRSTWISCAASEGDRVWQGDDISLPDVDKDINIRFVKPDPQAYNWYYNEIANPLLWFLHHSIWDFANAPTLNKDTWRAWNEGYVVVNQMVADEVVTTMLENRRPSLIMLQDYHLYLAPQFIRQRMGRRKGSLLTHFIHVPWPGPEDWGLLPERMRRAILTGLCSLDMLGFQTRDDALNFIRTCESLLPEAVVNYRKGRVMLNRNVTHVRDFPISIDVGMLRTASEMDEVRQFRAWFEDRFGDRQIIVRIDRTEPSKNIIRGFQAYDELLENHPEHHGRVQFFAILVPSRLGVNEYQDYLNGIMAAAGSVNAKYGSSEWEPVRVLVGESYPRAVAAMHLYDVLLVNPVADGMNLVAKEGPIVNEKAGVLVLSERAGAHQQLGEHALVISPCDVSATAEALHAALTMDPEERQRRAMALRKIVEREDINYWLCSQFETIEKVVDGRG
jgi:trehalose 6-phosphate synthase